MKPVQGAIEIVLPNVAAFGSPFFRVLDEITDRQPEIALDRGEDANHSARLARAMGVENISVGQFSEINQGLTGQVEG
jgi:hypothetical protein